MPSLPGSLATDNPYESIHMQLFFTLPDSCIIYPDHDYKSQMDNTIGDEKANNPRFGTTNIKGKFAEISTNLNLAYPKKIGILAAVPANMCCGVPDVVENADSGFKVHQVYLILTWFILINSLYNRLSFVTRITTFQTER